MIHIERFSIKRPFRRRQYHARIVCTENSKRQWRTSEGYNNRSERDDAVNALLSQGLTAYVLDVAY